MQTSIRKAQADPLERLSDEGLMALAVEGEQRAFDALVRRHRSAVRSLAMYACGPDLADDVTQSAFVSLWEQRARFEAGRGSPRAWLLSMVRNRGIDQLRKRATVWRHTLSFDPQQWFELAEAGPASEPADELAARAETRVLVQRALMRLPADQRAVIELCYFEGLSQQQAADRLGIPLGTVKGRTRLALGKLRSTFGDWDPVAGDRRPAAVAAAA